MSVFGDPQMSDGFGQWEKTVPGVYLSSRTMGAGIELPRTGTPAFLGVQGIDHVIRLDRHNVGGASLPGTAGKTRYAVRGFFANGGECCYLVPAQGNGSADLDEQDFHALGDIGDFDLVCLPDLAARLSPEQLAKAHAMTLEWCARDGKRFAVLDGPRTVSDLDAYHRALARDMDGKPSEVASFGAGYYPWLRIRRETTLPVELATASTQDTSDDISVPCSGHVAGVYSRTDQSSGVWVAPANEVVFGALALDDGGSQTADIMATASTAGFNALRSFRKRGIRVWGARTACADPALGYVTTRRVLQAVARRLEQVLLPIVFEPNQPLLWVRINRIVTAQLDALYRGGALTGGSAEQAYFVRCDASTNPPQVREEGKVVAEAGIAVVAPAEFIGISIRLGESDIGIVFNTLEGK